MQLPPPGLVPACCYSPDMLLSDGFRRTWRHMSSCCWPRPWAQGLNRQPTHKFFIQTRCLLVVFYELRQLNAHQAKAVRQARERQEGICDKTGRQCDALRQIRTDSTQICDTKYELASSFARQSDRQRRRRVPGMPLHASSDFLCPSPEQHVQVSGVLRRVRVFFNYIQSQIA